MSEPKVTSLSEETMQTIQALTQAYFRALDDAAGRQVKVAMVVAPTTLEHEQTDGSTQVQLLTNMEPWQAQKAFKDMSEVFGAVAANPAARASSQAFMMPGNSTAN